MDFQTIDYYRQNAAAVAQKYESVPSPLIAKGALFFAPGSRILDIGCGSGRDLSFLSEQGHSVYGVDATPEMVRACQDLHPHLQGRVVEGSLPFVTTPFGGQFDGAICGAVLMHISPIQLHESIKSIARCLRNDAPLVISIPAARDDVDEKGRDQFGRLFQSYRPEFLEQAFGALGFEKIDLWYTEDVMGRAGVKWMFMLFKKRDGVATQSNPAEVECLDRWIHDIEVGDVFAPGASLASASRLLARDLRAIRSLLTQDYHPVVESDRVIQDLRFAVDLLIKSSADGRRAGRAEALACLLNENAEDFSCEFMGEHAIADTGDYGAHWCPDKLAELFDVNPKEDMLSLLDRANGAYWTQEALIYDLEQENKMLKARLRAAQELCASASKGPLEQAREAVSQRG